MKQLTEREWFSLRSLRASLLEVIKERGGMCVYLRAENVKYYEDKAVILLHDLELSNVTPSVMDEVVLHGLKVPTWSNAKELYKLPDHLRAVPSKKRFRLVAFVRVPGEVRGGKALVEGMFCILSEHDPAYAVVDDTGMLDPVERICCDGDVREAGAKSFATIKKGKVLLYPIECLVPVETSQKIPFTSASLNETVAKFNF